MFTAVVRYLGRHPQALPEATFWNTVRMLDLQSRGQSRFSARAETNGSTTAADAGVIVFWAVGLLALAGIAVGVRRSPVRTLWLAPLVLLVSTVTVTSGTPRQRAGLDPFVICLAACAISRLYGRWAPGQAGVAVSGGPTISKPYP
jgi:MYXO-CTERM domain-containing protein